MFQTIEEKREFEADVIEYAHKNSAFREALRSDPKTALEQAYGRTVPVDVEVHSDSLEKMHLVLPVFADEMADDLSDDQLEAVSGGIWLARWRSLTK